MRVSTHEVGLFRLWHCELRDISAAEQPWFPVPPQYFHMWPMCPMGENMQTPCGFLPNGFLPLTKNICVRLIGQTKLPVGVSVNMHSCLSLYWPSDGLDYPSRVYPDIRPMAAGIGSSLIRNVLHGRMAINKSFWNWTKNKWHRHRSGVINPPQRPDLNITEGVWDHLDKEWSKRQKNNQGKLWNVL